MKCTTLCMIDIKFVCRKNYAKLKIVQNQKLNMVKQIKII